MKLNEHTSSTAIYLQQMQNHIDLGQGYDRLRKLLFRELHQLDGSHIVADDKLPESIAQHLANALIHSVNFHKTQQTFRIIQIIEDLITYAEDIITPALHTQFFISCIINVAAPKIITFNSNGDAENRSRILGIFWYWFERYGRDEDNKYDLFLTAYKDLRSMKLMFPDKIMIKPNDFFKRQVEKEKGMTTVKADMPNTNKVILSDIEQFTVKSELLSQESIRNITTTEYVRLIKHKSKVLYQFTTKPGDLTATDKNKVKDLYKRLRLLLKEIDKYNESSVQTNKMKQQQKIYVEQKITPKKDSQKKQQSLIQNSIPSPDNTKQRTQQIVSDKDLNLIDLGIEPLSSAPKPLKQSSAPISTISNITAKTNSVESKDTFDLLSGNAVQIQEEEQFIDGILVDTTPSDQMPVKKQQQQLFQVFSTPKKQVNEEEGHFLAKHSSNGSKDSSPSFQNEAKQKNPYSYIPDNLNLTPTSSAEDEQEKVEEKTNFNIFGLFKTEKYHSDKDLYDIEKRSYDSPYKRDKQSSQQKKPSQKCISVNNPPQQSLVQQNLIKVVTPVDYSIYALQRSPVSQHSEQDQQRALQRNKHSNKSEQNEIDMPQQPKSGQKIKLQDR